jgi:DNA-binding NarL/FixJ family response regulator
VGGAAVLAHDTIPDATVLEQKALAQGGTAAEVVATSARPRRSRTSGSKALTPTERRVARTVTDGAANRAAAEALLVSEKTVERTWRASFAS